MNIYAMFLNVGYGLQQGICALVGREIGLKNIERARRFQVIGYSISLALIVSCSITLYIFLPSLILKFLHSPSAAEPILNNPFLHLTLAFSYIPDAFKHMQLSIIKALALQKHAVKISMVSNWAVNLTLIYILGFSVYHMELLSLWLAKTVTEIIILVLNSHLIEYSDWHQIADALEQERQKTEVEDEYEKVEM